MPLHTVTATQLNLRSTPGVAPNNLIASLPNGQSVEDLDRATAPWWKIRTTFHGSVLTGFVHSSFLQAAASAPAAPTISAIKGVHLGENAAAKPSSGGARAYAIGDASAPRRSSSNRAASLAKIIEYLDVERGARYQPTVTSTFCNIYAYDYCYLAGVYLPRVWWMDSALVDLAQGRPVEVRYGVTVRELNANSLFAWLEDFGSRSGWRRVFDMDAMQAHANAGGVGVICAQRKELNRSGHIVAVVPETSSQTAARSGGRVVRPLQSQAGRNNFKYMNGPSAWWQGAEFREFGFFIAD
jgi:hypothetical protein